MDFSTLFLLVVLLLVIVFIVAYYLKLSREYHKLRLEFDSRVSQEANTLAAKMFNEWVNTRLNELKSSLEKEYQVRFETLTKSLQSEYEVKFQEWLFEKEREIREDAIKRSISTLLGMISEHIAPLFIAEKYEFNPKDLRFLGTPIDFIAFKGLSDNNPQEIIFIEVKSGKTSTLTPRERAVKRLVEEKKISWVTFNLREATERAVELLEREVKSIAEQQAKPSGKANDKSH